MKIHPRFHAGALLRWVLQQAAWVAYRSDDVARRIIHRISKRAGYKRAATAMGRKILVYAWSVCRNKKPFKWPEEITSRFVKKSPPAFENPFKIGRRREV